MDIVFNINYLGLEGLGATLVSLVRNCSDSSQLKFWFLCSELKKRHKDSIRQLLHNEHYEGNIEFVDFNARKTFGHLRSLHGDWTTYGRLLIPEILKSGRALYLDSDLVINLDILEFETFDSDEILAAVFGCTVEWSLDSSFLIQRLEWNKNLHYFNAGVLLFNLLKWKTENVDRRIKEISDKYPNEIISHDQTLLNAISKGNFLHLPPEFNLAWYPGKAEPELAHKAIIHFVGSPKPWDLVGKVTHKGYKMWNVYNTSFWKRRYGKVTTDKIRRTWKIRNSIFRHLKAKLLRF